MKFLSLRWKISGILVFSNIFLGLLIILIVNSTVTDSLTSELIERGNTIANGLSRYTAELILEEDVVGLKEIITSSLSFESVQYILIQDADQNILTDTYNGNVPSVLKNRTLSADIDNNHPALLTLTDENVDCYDIVVPVEEGSLGYIRVGMIRNYIVDKVRETHNYIILTIAIITLIGIIIVYFLANKIIKPILRLADRANAISRGDLEESVTIKTNDEINYMAQAVERLRESLNIALARLDKNKKTRL
jgi:HAMP domain-containing protein